MEARIERHRQTDRERNGDRHTYRVQENTHTKIQPSKAKERYENRQRKREMERERERERGGRERHTNIRR